MQSKSHLSIDLELEDFQRLGVRPDETRLTVIRRAASQTSRALAERQLSAPSATAALQLSRVTTSAYRLLDPRQRGDVQQRIHVGRILPTVLMWAGQTKFQNQQGVVRKASIGGVGISRQDNSANQDSGMLFRGGGLSEADLIELMELDTTPLLAGQPAWTQSLSDGDLLGRSQFMRRWNRVKGKLLSRWVVLGLSGLLLGLLVGLVRYRHGKDPTVNEATDQIEAADQIAVPDNSSIVAREALSGSFDKSTNPEFDPEQLGPIGTELNSVKGSELEIANPFATDATSLSDAITWDATSEAMFDLESPVVVSRTTTTPSADNVVSVPRSENDRSELSESGFLPDPFARDPASAKADFEQLDNRGGDLSGPAMTSSNNGHGNTQGGSDTGGKGNQRDVTSGESQQPIPIATAVDEARTQILLLDPTLMRPITVESIPLRLIALERMQQDFEPDSVEYWTVSLMLAENAWLTEDASKVGNRLSDLQVDYVFVLHSILSETYLKANDPSSLPEIQMCLLANGLALIDRLLSAEEFQLATQVLASVEPLTEVLKDKLATGYLNEYSRTILQAERLQENSKRLLASNTETWSKGNTGLLGRYYCLVLRHWDQGLGWLCDAADSRIASAAKQEFALQADASADELIAMARRWIFNASKTSGTAMYSMRLHAISLVRRAMEITTESQRLELDVELQAMIEVLPAHLQRVASDNVSEESQ